MLAKPYLILAALIGILAVAGGSFGKGAEWGRTRAVAQCQAEKLEAQQREIVERAALQAAIDERTRERDELLQRTAEVVDRVRTEYLPSKTIVKREIVRLSPDCRIGDGLRGIVNAALAGRPVSSSQTEPAADSGVPGRTGSTG